MSDNLLSMIMVDCKFMNYSRTDDGMGGYKPAYTEGASFKAAIGKDGSPEMLVAEKQGLSESFTVVTADNFLLKYNDVFKRVSDGAIFRVTSNGNDSVAHPASTIRIAKVTAERWELPA